jgi:hypothetical protein
MTFIASVIAKKGVAIIADSLVTSSRPVIEYEDFANYIKKKAENKDKEIKIEPKEIIELFKTKASHTKDYEEKLFKYDDYTAITTAGAANINGKKIEVIINEAVKKIKPNQKKSIDENVENLNNSLLMKLSHILKLNLQYDPLYLLLLITTKQKTKPVFLN